MIEYLIVIGVVSGLITIAVVVESYASGRLSRLFEVSLVVCAISFVAAAVALLYDIFRVGIAI